MGALQVRDVPEVLSRELKIRAAASGRSLSQYLLEQLFAIVQAPTAAQVVEMIMQRERVEVSDPVDELHRGRECS